MSIKFSKNLIPIFALGMGMQLQSGQSSFLQTPPSAEEIPSDTLEERQDVNPIEAVKSLPGVILTGSEVTTYTSSLFVRGSNADHTLFVWNDFRSDDFTAPSGATDPFGFGIEFSNRIRVLKGPQSLLYGTQALGGVVLIDQDPDLGTTFELAGGSLNTSRGLSEARTRGEKWQLAVGGSAFSTEGVSTYNAAIPRGKGGQLERDGRQKSSGSAILSLDLPSEDQLQFMLSARRDTLSYDAPPLDDINAHAQNNALQWKARYKVNWGDRAESVFLLMGQDTRRENTNPADIYDSNYYVDQAKGHRSLFLNRNSFLWLKSLWQVGLEASQEEGTFDSNSNFNPAGSSFRSETSEQSLYLVNDWNFQRSDLSWGVRGSCQKSEECLAVYQVSYQWHWPDEQRSLYGLVSTGLKRPSMYQLYAVRYGDPSLEAETSQAYEVGFIQRWGAPQRVKVSFFENQFSNLIDFDLGLEKFKNLSSAKTHGLEIMHQYDAVMWDTQFSIAQIYAKDETTGQYLLRRPVMQGAWELGYDIFEPLRVAGELVYIGDREDTVGTTRVTLDAVTLLNLSLTYKRNFAQYFVRVNNAGNSFYEDIKGYLTPGRFVWLGAKISF